MTTSLLLGDAYSLVKTIPTASVDLVIIDPPYVVDTVGNGMYKQKDKRYILELATNDMNKGFSFDILDELCRVLKKINIYVFASQKQIMPLLQYFVTQKKCNWNILSWHKTNPIPNCGNKYITDTEFILFFRERGVKIYGNSRTKKTWYTTPLNQKDKKQYHHPTVKPLEIVKNLILNSSQEGDTVFDCFMGSGTTGEACARTNRNFIGIEIVPEYFKTARIRITESARDYGEE